MFIKPTSDFFDKLGKKAYLVVLGLILFIEIIVFKNYFFNQLYCFKTAAFSDSFTQFYPWKYFRADYIAKYGILKWSFNLGMGQNVFQFFLYDPFDIFLYLAGKDHVLYLMVYREMAKILFGGLIFFYYLKTLKLSNYTAIIGSLLFAFCGFMIIGNGWSYFSFEVFNMALLLLAFELLFSRQIWYLFPLPILLMGVSMPFNLYLYGVFLTLYTLLRHLQTGTFDFKKLRAIYLRMIGLGIIGLLLSAPFLIENTIGLFESPRGNGSSSYASGLLATPLFSTINKFQFGTCIMRFFSNEVLGTGSGSYTEFGNAIDWPMFYCGLPCLLLMPQLFQFLNRRLRIIFTIFLIVWLLPFIFPYLRYTFWLFTGDYYREYSFFVSLILLYYSLEALEHIIQQRKTNRIALVITLIILLALINFPFFDNDTYKSHVSPFVMAMLIAYGIMLFFIAIPRNTIYFKWFFLAGVVFELTYLTGISVNKRDAVTSSELLQKKGYNDYSIDAINYIKHGDKSFYRIDKSYGSAYDFDGPFGLYHSRNDGMIQNYFGTSCYSSFNQKYYISYLELMGLANKASEGSTRWAAGLFSFHFLEAENSVKYILTHTINSRYLNTYFDSLSQIGDVKILRNKFALPLGYTYKYFMNESRFNSLSFDQKNFVSIRACVVKDKEINNLAGLKEYNGIINDSHWKEAIEELKKDTFVINQFNPNFIAGAIDLNEDKMMYLSIPYDIGWNLKVDGKPTDKIILDGGMTGVMLLKGNHSIELKYELPFIDEGLCLSLLGILAYVGCWFFEKRSKRPLL